MCYKYECNAAKDSVTIKVTDTNSIICTVAGEEKIIDNAEFHGTIKCPNPNYICNS